MIALCFTTIINSSGEWIENVENIYSNDENLFKIETGARLHRQ